MANNFITTSFTEVIQQKISDYKQLVKLRLNLLVVFSAVITYMIAASAISMEVLLLLSFGGFLCDRCFQRLEPSS